MRRVRVDPSAPRPASWPQHELGLERLGAESDDDVELFFDILIS